MKILLCIPFQPEAPKGNSVAASRLARGFIARGHPTTLLGHPDVDAPEKVHRLALSLQPDICLIMHAWRCAGAVHALERHTSIPRVVSLRGTDLNEMLDDPATGPEIAGILDGSAGIVVFHRQGQDQLSRKNPAWHAKIRIIPNGAALPCSQVDYRKRLGIASQVFVFTAICGLREVKRPLLVLPWLDELAREAASQRSAVPGIAFAHTGLPLEPEVAQAFGEFAAGHSWLHHLEQVPHEEIDSFLRAGDVFIAASRSEGMPHAVREAMLAGVPALLSDIDGHRTMATPEREALFFKDRDEFLAQAKRLLSDESLRRSLGQAAKARAEADLARQDEITAYLDLFTELLAKEPRR